MTSNIDTLARTDTSAAEPLYYWSNDAEVIRSDGFATKELAYSDAFSYRAECFDDPSQNDRFFLHHGHMVKNVDFDKDYAPSEDNAQFLFEGTTTEVLAHVVLDYFHDQWLELTTRQIKALPDRNALTRELLKLPEDDHRAHYDFIQLHRQTLAAALDDTIHIQFADNGFVRQWQEQPFNGSEAFDTAKLVMRLGTFNHQAQQRCDMLEGIQQGLRLMQEKFPCINTTHEAYRIEVNRLATEMLSDISKVIPLPLFDNVTE